MLNRRSFIKSVIAASVALVLPVRKVVTKITTVFPDVIDLSKYKGWKNYTQVYKWRKPVTTLIVNKDFQCDKNWIMDEATKLLEENIFDETP